MAFRETGAPLPSFLEPSQSAILRGPGRVTRSKAVKGKLNVAPFGAKAAPGRRTVCKNFSVKYRRFCNPLIFIGSQTGSDRSGVSKFRNAVSARRSPTCDGRNRTSVFGLSRFFGKRGGAAATIVTAGLQTLCGFLRADMKNFGTFAFALFVTLDNFVSE